MSNENSPRYAKRSFESNVNHFFSVLSKKYPKYASQIRSVSNTASGSVDILDKTYPILESAFTKTYDLLSGIGAEELEELAPLIFGLVMCFFGGCFILIISVVEAVRMSSWDTVVNSGKTLYKNYIIALEASRKDDLMDEDGNGIPDVQEISRKMLLSRKMNLFFASVDPVEVSKALHAMFLALMAAFATLQVSFAGYMTFGCGFASTIRSYLPLESMLEEALPPEEKKLAGTLTSTILNVIGMLFASIAQAYIATLYCVARGSTLFSSHILKLGKIRGFVEPEMTMESPQVVGFTFILFVLGFFWQASHSFSLPFPFNVILFPFVLIEWILTVCFQTWVSMK